MKLKRLSRYFYKHPKALLSCSLVVSLGLHAGMLIQIPFLRFTSLPAQKGKMTIINVSLEKVYSKTNIVKKKKKLEEEKKEVFKEIVKKEDTIPYLKKEEQKKEANKENIEKERLTPPPPSVSKDIIIKAEETYEDKILKRINVMKYYPMLARKRGEEGVVKVEFTLKKDGALKGEATIIERCRYSVLNDAAIKTIVIANPYPVFPNEITKEEMTFIVDVDFRLEVW